MSAEDNKDLTRRDLERRDLTNGIGERDTLEHLPSGRRGTR
jgi:hypothetical protein